MENVFAFGLTGLLLLRIAPEDVRALRELAKRENLCCKVSGMVTEADWTSWNVRQLKPYFDVVLSAFGPGRLMFGSDWPVLTLAGHYGGWVHAFQSLIAELSPDERERRCRRSIRSNRCVNRIRTNRRVPPSIQGMKSRRSSITARKAPAPS